MTTLNRDRVVTLNCGLGRDSLTMLALCFEGQLRAEGLGPIGPSDLDAVVFSDTGCEWPHTYALLEQVASLCAERGVRFVALRKGDAPRQAVADWSDVLRNAAGGGYHRRAAIMADFQSRATVASLGKGDCTDNHKIQPIRRFIDDVSQVRFGLNNRRWSAAVRRGERRPHLTLIGIAADETARIARAGRGRAYVSEAYPLLALGVTKADEAAVLGRWGLAATRKSGCYMCPYQPANWWWALSVQDPATYARVVAYERTALARNPRMPATGFKIAGERVTIPDVVARWRAANPDATAAAVLDKTYTRCDREARAHQRNALLGAHRPVHAAA